MNPKEQEKLVTELTERVVNNSAAVNLLVDLVCKSGLISIDEFNRRVAAEVEEVKDEMVNNITK